MTGPKAWKYQSLLSAALPGTWWDAGKYSTVEAGTQMANFVDVMPTSGVDSPVPYNGQTATQVFGTPSNPLPWPSKSSTTGQKLRASIQASPALQNTINHLIDPSEWAPPTSASDPGGSVPPGAFPPADPTRCEWNTQWDDQLGQYVSIHQGMDWQTTLDVAAQASPDELAFYEDQCDEAWSIFENAGGVEMPFHQIMNATQLDNPALTEELSQLGRLEDWWKVTSPAMNTAAGNEFEVHWYWNQATGARYIWQDFKVKFMSGFWFEP
jgi:hypothetical protein